MHLIMGKRGIPGERRKQLYIIMNQIRGPTNELERRYSVTS